MTFTTRSRTSWPEANREYLVAEFARLREQLEAKGGSCVPTPETRTALRRAHRKLRNFGQPAAINRLTEIFELSPFERDVLLLCAGVELDSASTALHGAPLVQRAGGTQRLSPTFGLALAALAQPHWSALTPGRPLRRFRLIEMQEGPSLTTRQLHIDERILHYLAGINELDPHLRPILQPVAVPTNVANEHVAIANELANLFGSGLKQLSLVHLCGDDLDGQRDVTALAVSQAGYSLFAIRAEDIPSEIDQFLDLWTRESELLRSVLLIEVESAALTSGARRLAERIPGPAVLCTRDPVQLTRDLRRYEVNKPVPAEQRRLWRQALGPAAHDLNGFVDNLAEQFRLSAHTIQTTGIMHQHATPDALWKACRSFARPRLEDLAERIVPSASWNDLILPDPQKRTLQQIAAQVSCRLKVYETWGFASRGRRGLGISALFSGESGTGKTLAAEVLASTLGLDLYRIDLSAIVSKYIGETEKNLRQVFDAAESGGVLLLFDEADALFGKRSEVKDSHDRYANVEVAYLLQRMENYQGLAVLTTNLKSSIDRAFQRRLRFIVHFPFPDTVQREAIWDRIFPAAAPTTGLKPAALAQLKMPGGNIRNIAMNAAFLAAEERRPIEMTHLLEAARLESQKIERPLSEAEIRGWI